MSRMEAIKSVSLEAASDLSTHQFKFVVQGSGGQVALVASNGGDADGVLLNKPDAAGRAAEVAVGGIAKVIAAGTITRGGKVSSTAAGLAQAAASTHHVLGRAMTSVAVNELVEVLLDSSHHLLV